MAAMCGRMVRTSPAEALRAELGVEPPAATALPPRWNVCPGEDVLAVVRARDGLRMGFLRWGLVPHFAPDPRGGARAINARAETLATRPAFRDALARRRCLVVCDGFYEWRREGGTRQPFFVRLRSGRPMTLAGLWARWRPPDGGAALVSCTVVTCPPNAVVAPLHDRMPVVLAPDVRDAWLDPETPSPQSLCVPCAPDLLEAWPVSSRVNSPQHDDAELIRPAESA
jgi:putative SOS response-associated peptidase YedK